MNPGVRGILVVLILCLGLSPRIGSASGYDPTGDYEVRQMDGWTLRINQKLAGGDALLFKATLRLLEFQLYQITRVVPAAALARLREIPIWIELDDTRFPCMCYHPSPDWLREHDINPEKAGGVEIANAKNFLNWTKDQPWMVLHELAHSYHHRVLNFENPEIKAAYEKAKGSKTYDRVLRINGRRESHYALTDEQEYFAEATEAYFGTNDFFPFVRAELKEHDPEMFKLLEKVWCVEKASGEPKEKPASEQGRSQPVNLTTKPSQPGH
ncbi:MAG: hypothetical protein JWR69_1456 [Pedosphaera sp.]|nr:hypothetical protein [Pedosphaera sp.]